MAGADALQKKLLRDLPIPDANAPRFSWEFKRRSLHEKMMTEDWNDFLSWPVITESFHTGFTDSALLKAKALTPRLKEAATFPKWGGLSGTSIQQAWCIHQWEMATGRGVDSVADLKYVHEFGGGYGAMALLLRRLGYKGLYTITDFPEVHLLRYNFLARENVFDVHPTEEPIQIPSLYIALCSLSEVEPEKRDIPEAQSYLITYQEHWGKAMRGDWDNKSWFPEWMDSKKQHTWSSYPDPYNNAHIVMIGWRQDD